MQRIINHTHSKATFAYAGSRALERAAYYGLRSIMLLYMVSETINITHEEASIIYAWFVGSFIFSNILGAVLGDLLLGNKRAMIIGGVLQAFGIFSFCFPSVFAVYTGLVLVVVGGGLYTPNILSIFGKIYQGKQKLLDSGFMIFYTSINLGVILGSFFISSMGYPDYTYGFITSGILMLCAVIIPLFIKEGKTIEADNLSVPFDNRFLHILIAIILLGIFWTTYDIAGNRIFDLERKFIQFSNLQIPSSMLYSLSSLFLLPVGIIAAIAWSCFYSKRYIKLAMGFIFATLSYVTIFLIPELPSEQHLYYYLFSFLLMSIAEMHVSPVIYAILTRYGNPKYLAIIMSFAFVPNKVFGMIAGLFNKRFLDDPMFALNFGLITMLVTGAGLMLFALAIKQADDEIENPATSDIDRIGEN